MTARAATAALLPLLALLLVPALPAQSGEALGVAPDRVTVEDAQAGETYVRGVSLQHQYDSEGTIRVQVDGPESAWVTTDPASPFTMPPRTNRAVAVTIAIPGNALPGAHNTTLRFIRGASEQPSGTGAAVEVSAGIHLDLLVGGEPVENLTYLSARVEDAAQGDPVHAFVTARNDGNVRATAQASGQVLPFEADAPVLANATGSIVLLPGEEGEVPVSFAAALEVGQYRANLTAGAFAATLPFKVTPQGHPAPDGTLRAITHIPRATAHQPVALLAWFENSGAVAIDSAAAHVEVHRGGAGGPLLAELDSAPAALQPGQHANLTMTWTPPKEGTYTLVGRVAYDGFTTLPNENLLNVVPAEVPFPWWFVVLVAIALVAVLVAWWWRRRRDHASRR
jgi:hypothetical protein